MISYATEKFNDRLAAHIGVGGQTLPKPTKLYMHLYISDEGLFVGIPKKEVNVSTGYQKQEIMFDARTGKNTNIVTFPTALAPYSGVHQQPIFCYGISAVVGNTDELWFWGYLPSDYRVVNTGGTLTFPVGSVQVGFVTSSL
jgi:hypothetical protein